MAADQHLAERLRLGLIAQNVVFEEKKMFGGLAFMVNTHMTVGITNKNELMVRCDKANHEALLKLPGCNPMLFTGKPMAGFLFIDQAVVDKDDDLQFWIKTGLEFALNNKPKVKK
jgi:TfoX/Sxy family transcriptional regulator of competence genes